MLLAIDEDPGPYHTIYTVLSQYVLLCFIYFSKVETVDSTQCVCVCVCVLPRSFRGMGAFYFKVRKEETSLTQH